MNTDYIDKHLIPALTSLGVDCLRERNALVLPSDGISAGIRMVELLGGRWSFDSLSPLRPTSQGSHGGWRTDAYGNIFELLLRLRLARPELRNSPMWRVAMSLMSTGFMKDAELRWDAEKGHAWWRVPTYPSLHANMPPGFVSITIAYNTQGGEHHAHFGYSDNTNIDWRSAIEDRPNSTERSPSTALMQAVANSYAAGAAHAACGAEE